MAPVKESSSKGEFLKRMAPVKESSSKGEFLKRMVPVQENSSKGGFLKTMVPVKESSVAVLLVFFVTCEARNNTEKISMTQEWNAWREHKSRSVKDGKRHAQIRSVLLRAFNGSSCF